MADLIHNNTPIPLYYQLQEILRDKIENGVWKSGDRLPTEIELCKEYDVSRITVRNALQQLRMEGIINRAPGRGTTVAQPKVREFLLMSINGSFADRRNTSNFYTKILESGIVEPPDKARIKLGLETDGKVTKLVRIRYVKDEPLFWGTVYVPYEICPELINNDFEHRSFFEILNHEYDLLPNHTVRTIEMELATNRETNYLEVIPGTPIYIIQSVTFLENGVPFEYSRNFFRGDRVKLIVSLHKSDEDVNLIHQVTQEQYYDE